MWPVQIKVHTSVYVLVVTLAFNFEGPLPQDAVVAIFHFQNGHHVKT